MTFQYSHGRYERRAILWLVVAMAASSWITTSGAASCAAAEAPRGKVRFNRDIRPILSENCFRCHGPDPGSREADLRFDREDGLFEDHGAGAPVVRGKPEESLLFQRITADDEYTIMPPPETHKQLSSEQKELIARWISDGATWEPHWSLVKPARPALPAVNDEFWVRNPIDRFILESLENGGLAPAPETDRRTIIRRVSFDLTGLPPTPAEVEAFVADASDDAYERLVDRLLSSEHYGEHRARYWLDAARYADTHGLHIDNYREIWPYREWVISAFNRNLPFDRFTIEQLAGDLLPDRTMDQHIASGFHRCNITTNEGGAIPDEVAAIYAKDRVETTATVWLGMTAGCAACHDHKFDPFTQREFYQFAAYFRNTTQNPLDGNIASTPPVIVVPRDEDRERWLAISSKIERLESEKLARRTEAAAAFEAWLRDGGHRELAQPIDAADQELALALQERAGSTHATAIVAGAEQSIALASGVSLGDGSLKSSRAARFEKRGALDLGNVADFEADQAFSVSAWVFAPLEDGAHAIISKLGRNAGWSITITSRLLLASLAGGKKGDTAAVRANGTARLTPGTWSHVCMTYDGSRHASGISLFVNGKPLPLNQVRPDETEIKGSLRNDGPLMIGSDGTRSFDGGAIHDLRIDRRRVRDDEIQLAMRWRNIRLTLSRRADQLNQAARDDLLLAYLNLHDEAYRAASQALADAESQIGEIRARGSVTHVMHEIADSMPMANVLVRGQYDQLGDRVEPAVPAMLHDLPPGVPNNRLGLAHWLVDRDNPLTARVTVNRFWQELFGTGLVRSSEDFGIMGDSPVHPELLDWLAVEFRESKWDVKRLFRLIATSAAYRQAAVATEEKLKKDPGNRLLSRGPRYRLDAEMLRDYALAASGLLVREIGGPSVKPYQPEGVWEAVAMNSSNTRVYVQDHGDSLYRRSMYTFWKRSAPPASMDIFNAPSRENCTVRRERTNTPLQALVTMNDPQFVEAARHLADRALSETSSTFGERLDFMTLHLVSRPFETHERDVCRSALDAYRAYFAERHDAAQQLIATGESKPCGSVDAVELAAWTMLANQLMNLDEALNK